MCVLLRRVGLIWLFCGVAAAQKPGVEGSWEGPVQTFAGKIRLRVHISRQPGGEMAGKMDSPDQGAFGIPLTTISFTGGVLKWDKKEIQASFEGKLNDAGDEISGTFKQGGLELPLSMKRMAPGAATGPNRPQEPKPPFPYLSEDVAFPSKAPGVTLAGTITLPKGKGPFPAVALITGSGPQDRNESLMGHKPFLVLADHLTRNGIAVLRYDDRGFGKSTGSFMAATSADFADDAEGALDYLRKRPEVDPKRAGLAGHSEGGVVAPMVAARRSDVAFVILLAGTAVPGKDVLLAQAAKISEAAGAPTEAIEKNRDFQTKIWAVLAEEKDNAAAEAKIKGMLAGVPSAEAEAKRDTTPWFRFFAFYDPAPIIEKLRCPVLAVNGELDLQVIPDQNLPVIESALQKGGNKEFLIVRLPRLNHLFQTAQKGLPAEYGQIEETMAPVMLDMVARWIRRTTGLEAR